jgi:tetratricopeptide (TPR) repeat protein
MTKTIRTTILTGVLVLAATAIQAQTQYEAAATYKNAAELYNTDYVAAIDSFEKCIKMCEVVGAAADEVKGAAIKVLPVLYQKKMISYTNDKKYPEAILASKKTFEVATQYNDTTVLQTVKNAQPNLYASLGFNLQKANDNAGAIQAFDSAISINPNFSKAIFGKALSYIRLNNNAKVVENIDLAITKTQADNDSVFTQQIQKLGRDYFKSAGLKSKQAKKFADALDNFNTSLKYGEDKDVYYNIANINNAQKKYDLAITNAQKGLDLEPGDANAKAKYIYELAVAQAGKGLKNDACGNYKSAMINKQFEAACKAQMTNLKCK